MGLRILFVSGCVLVGCIAKVAPVRLAESTPVLVAYAFDSADGNAPLAVPEDLQARVRDALRERNLAGRSLSDSSWVEVTRTARDTPRRLAEAIKAAAGAKLVLLVELEADYASQLSGRYAWRVYSKFTVADPREVATAVTEQTDLPAMLQWKHEREAEAVTLVTPLLAERIAMVLDTFLRGRPEFQKAAAAEALGAGVRAGVSAGVGAGGGSGAVRDSAGGSGSRSGSGSRAAPLASDAMGGSMAGGQGGDLIYFVLVDRFRDAVPGNNVAVDKANPSAWHGGDLQGVERSLDYLADLGVRTLWLSPVFQTRSEPFDGHAAFHGYWVEDLRVVDARFGGMPALKALIDAAHARHMRVLLDVVVNHVAFGAPLVREHPEWFHPQGGIDDWSDAHELETHEVHGLPDLAQERADVYAYLTGAAAVLIREAKPDGFRLDAVKHVPTAFWRRYTDFLRGVAAPGFVTLGELFDGRSDVVGATQLAGGFSNMFDFPLAFALREVFCQGAAFGSLAAVLSADREYADPSSLVTFVDNHDLPRLASICAPAQAASALSALFALRGTPALTYGTEAGLQGEHEPDTRGDMRFAPAGDAPLVALVKSLAAERFAHPALASGATRVIGYADDALTLVRFGADESLVVGFNASAVARPLILAAAPPAACRLRESTAVAAPAAARGAGRVMAEGLVPAHGVVVWSLGGAGCIRALLGDASPTREVELVASGAEVAELWACGAANELGRWDPARGVRLMPKVDGTFVGQMRLPSGGVYAYKLVGRDSHGKVRWETGDNRYLFVAAAAPSLRLTVQTRALQ